MGRRPKWSVPIRSVAKQSVATDVEAIRDLAVTQGLRMAVLTYQHRHSVQAIEDIVFYRTHRTVSTGGHWNEIDLDD